MAVLLTWPEPATSHPGSGAWGLWAAGRNAVEPEPGFDRIPSGVPQHANPHPISDDIGPSHTPRVWELYLHYTYMYTSLGSVHVLYNTLVSNVLHTATLLPEGLILLVTFARKNRTVHWLDPFLGLISETYLFFSFRP